MKQGLRKLFAFTVGILSATILKIFPLKQSLITDQNFQYVFIVSMLLFVGSNVAEHINPNTDSTITIDDKKVERKLIAFIVGCVVLFVLICLGKLESTIFTICFISNISLFITGNIIGDHLFDSDLKTITDGIEDKEKSD